MAKVTRLHVALDRLDTRSDLPQEAMAHPAQLRLDESTLILRIGASQTAGSAGSLRLRAEPAWLPGLVTAFTPVLDRLGTPLVRPCLAVIGYTDTGAIVDLFPVAGPRTTLGPAAPGDPIAWKGLVPPLTAAMLLAGLILPASAATYEVRAGDTLDSISRKLLGTASGWRQLFKLNRVVLSDPDRLVPGMVLQVPEADPAPRQGAAEPARIVVKPGDTLFSLAKRHLGDGAKWPQLWAGLRRSVRSPAHLPVGLTVPLPGAALAVTRPASPAPDAGPADLPATSQTPPQSDTPPAITPAGEPAAPMAVSPIDDTQPHVPAVVPPASEAPALALAPVPPEPAAAVSMVAAIPVIERPFGTHMGLSFNPVNYTESIAMQQVTAKGTIFNSFGAEGTWRIGDWCEVAGNYLYNEYPMTRVIPTPDRRSEHHGRLTGYVVWPLLPQLELAAGIGGQLTGYGVVVGPPVERLTDVYDAGYQRVLTHGEAKVGWRPWPDQPLTLTAGLHGIPFGQGFRLGEAVPIRLWGFGWSAGLRYSLNGFALEARYRGQRLFGPDYGQSADLLHTGIGYYFR